MKLKPELHPACATWPKMPENGLIELAEDIKQKGQLEDITLTSDGKLLDGNSRWDACELAGVEPRTMVYQGNDPVGFVISKNKHRKHLEQGQLAIVVAELVKLKPGTNQYEAKQEVVLPENNLSVNALAKQAGLSRSAVNNARAVLNHGAPNVVTMVKEGEVNLRTAAEAVRSTPKKTQANWTKEDVKKEGRKAINAYPSNQDRKAVAKESASKKPKKETYIQRVIRTAELCRPTKPPLTREQVDPDFKGTNQDWVDQYGHVQIRTKAQMEIDRDQDAFSAWVGGIRSLRVPLRDYLAIGKFNVERYHAWIKKAPNQEKRLTEIKELASLIVQTRESIDWLLPFLETKQTNGDTP